MTPEWTDVTSYSQGQRGKTEPRSWQLRTANLRITVTRRIHMDGWWLFESTLGIHEAQLGATDIECAKAEAIERVRSAIAALAIEAASLPSTPHHP